VCGAFALIGLMGKQLERKASLTLMTAAEARLGHVPRRGTLQQGESARIGIDLGGMKIEGVVRKGPHDDHD